MQPPQKLCYTEALAVRGVNTVTLHLHREPRPDHLRHLIPEHLSKWILAFYRPTLARIKVFEGFLLPPPTCHSAQKLCRVRGRGSSSAFRGAAARGIAAMAATASGVAADSTARHCHAGTMNTHFVAHTNCINAVHLRLVMRM